MTIPTIKARIRSGKGEALCASELSEIIGAIGPLLGSVTLLCMYTILGFLSGGGSLSSKAQQPRIRMNENMGGLVPLHDLYFDVGTFSYIEGERKW